MKWEEIFKKYMIDTLEFVKSASGEVLTQGQLYIHELIKWEIIDGLMAGITTLLVVTGSLVLMYRALSKAKDLSCSDRKDRWFLVSLAFIIAIVPLTYISFINFNKAIKAYVAPRLVVMEKLQEAIK